MVSKRRQVCGFLGYGAPAIPKAPRSIRKRDSRKRIPEDGNLCAFELLAAVAGKLLEESESSTSCNVAEEEKVKPCFDRDGNENKNHVTDDKALNSESLDHTNSASTDDLEKFNCDTKLGICDIKNDDGSICAGSSDNDAIDSEQLVYSDSVKDQTGDTSPVKDLKQECVNTNTILHNSESGVQFPLYRDHISSVDHWENVKLGVRDDDEKSFDGNKFRAKIRSSFRSQPRFIHRGIAKTGSSRFRIAAPKMKDRDLYNSREAMKLFYRYRKNAYTRERCHYAPIKKRKLYYDKSGYDQDTSCDSVSNAPNKALSPTKKVHKKATDSKVKLKIKSFYVPELYIDVAETDTVGSLKRAVMEAVTSLLGGGMRVGVVLKGRKCRDDRRTLQQAGIYESSNLDTLGFTLEPKLSHVPRPSKVYDRSPRSASTPVIESGISNVSVDPTPSIKVEDDNNSNLVPSPQTPPNNESSDNIESNPDSKALVPVHPMNAEPLTIIPVNAKPKSSELSQRRTRRPFSVAEVEALVSAVERLGTGRWRDVKMGAFENTDHRTYVDLKDKWKTLVHTASISPQQRRGEPVPQELLDRVLAAHSYWSQHQSKHHGKNSNNESPVKIVSLREEIAQA